MKSITIDELIAETRRIESKHEGVTTTEICDATGMSDKVVRKLLRKGMNIGMVKPIKVTRIGIDSIPRKQSGFMICEKRLSRKKRLEN